MDKTQKVVLGIVVVVSLCIFSAVICYSVLYVLGFGVAREPTRLDYASEPKRSGTYAIGDDKEMAYGTWRHSSNKYGCEWRTYWDGYNWESASRGEWTVQSGTGKKVYIISSKAEYFETRGCGTWYLEE